MAYIQDWGMRVQAQPQINTTRRSFLHLSQNENGRMLNIRITDVNIPAGSTAVLAGTKPDGTVYSQTGTLAGNTATFAEDVQMTAVAGTWDAKITVTNGGNCICTARITITIDPDTVAGGAIPSDSQLDGIIAECRAIADSVRKEAYGSPLVADAVEDMTDQSRVYVYTGSETGYTSGHWYYYNGSAWADGGVYNAVAVDTDTTLTIAGKAADAKEVGDQITDLKEDLTRIEAIIPILAGRGKTWAEIKQNVKMGYGESLYPVGTDFSVDCPTGAPYDSIVWTVVDHRVENGEHIMTLLMKHVIYGLQFDAPQAIIVPDETMAAGTYHFKLLSGYDTAYDGGKSVQFTLANDLAAGGQIVMNWPYNQTWIGKNITVYDEFGTTVIETCVMSEGTGGTDLGDADGTVSILNHTQSARYGSNNYKESALREWLNSGDAAGLWQTQQTRFQRPCSYAANRAGFVTYLDPEFAAVIREGTHLNRTNEVFDLNGKKQAYSTTEKFFLPSQEEIGFSPESGIVCGTTFDFYSGAAQSDKIKYDITAQTTARNWRLRTPTPSTANFERGMSSSGALDYTNASVGSGASAACEI